MSTAPSPLSSQKRDGRRARRDRSRDQAVDAFLDLVDEGVTRPTAQQVAERSGVSLRSIFRIFDDVETLHTEAAGRQLSRSRHLYVEVPDAGPLPERIAEMVATLDRLYAEIAPVRRVGLRLALESPALQSQLGRARGWLVSEAERVFGGELDGRPGHERDLAAIELLLSFEAWDQLASAQDLADEERRAVLERALRAVLAPPAP
jgi:AcrR family transcriptional regulator